MTFGKGGVEKETLPHWYNRALHFFFNFAYSSANQCSISRTLNYFIIFLCLLFSSACMPFFNHQYSFLQENFFFIGNVHLI